MSLANKVKVDINSAQAIEAQMAKIGTSAKKAAHALAHASTAEKNAGLEAMAKQLLANIPTIMDANKTDIMRAKENGQTEAFIDRLKLDEDGINAMATGLLEIAALPDPIGDVIAEWDRPNGLKISRVRVPLGVIGIIYESRPNVTADAGALCMKSGNAVILRGGSDGFQSSQAILVCLQEGLKQAGLPKTAIQMVPTTDRLAVGMMLAGLNNTIDLIVPRGGKSLVKRVQEEARVPVFSHLEGICHVYVDKAADPEMARDIVLNAKMRRVGICGAAETLLVDSASAEANIPSLVETLHEAGCEVRGDETAQKLSAHVKPATQEDWHTEYLDNIIALKTVDGVDGAIEHIDRYGSNHTDSIVTEDAATAEKFLNTVDSAIVLHNASTQYADGGQFGMGAEIGIATGKMHARGPVGLEQLTSFKYVVRGTGQTRP